MLNDLGQDVGYAVRQIRRQPGFALGAVALVLVVAAVAAAGMPARRALRVDPTVALRYE